MQLTRRRFAAFLAGLWPAAALAQAISTVQAPVMQPAASNKLPHQIPVCPQNTPTQCQFQFVSAVVAMTPPQPAVFNRSQALVSAPPSGSMATTATWKCLVCGASWTEQD